MNVPLFLPAGNNTQPFNPILKDPTLTSLMFKIEGVQYVSYDQYLYVACS